MEIRHGIHLPALLKFILLLLFINTCSSSPQNDLLALLSFKSFITKDPSSALSSWNALNNTTSNGTQSFCRWTGVTCSGHLSSGRVTALCLRGLRLVGTISVHLGNLTHLQDLDLSDNKLEGEIPPSLANCIMLQKLNLSINFLSGTFPSTMGHLSKLAVFSIGMTNISGIIPLSFANLTALTSFTILSNYVHGEIPPWFGNFTQLTVLNIGVNMMSGRVPPSLSKLTYLKSLNLVSNKLEGVMHPSLFNMSSLVLLNFGLNPLIGSFPPDIGFTLPNLKELAVFYTEFEGLIPSSLSNSSALQRIILHGNRFSGLIPPNIGMNGNLTVFEVGNNSLQAAKPRDWDFLTSLANCSNLWSFNIQLNNLSGILPSTIANLSLELQDLYLGGNQIVGHVPVGIGRYYKLRSLQFSSNLFTGTIPSEIGKLSKLHNLWLHENAFHGVIPLSLGNITQLNFFKLSTNYLEGTIPATIGNLSMLTFIDLSNNLLSGQIPQEIVSISSLSKSCNLSNNALSGPIPPQIGRLVNLGILDLSSNKLSGEIPSTLGTCIELQFLYLQGNLLQGKIPKELSELKGLEVMHLSDNKLSGSIPEFLENFKLLRNLNLSFNQLSGPVPKEGIFSNVSSVSLTSNGALCGGPLFFHFPTCPSPVVPGSPTRHQLLHILIPTVVGGFSFVIICIVTYYYINKLRSNPDRSSRDNGSTFATEMYQRISYAELSMATNSFSEDNLIGCGNFSSVYKGILSCGGHPTNLAVKVLDLRQRRANRSFMSECNALKRIKHRKLVKIITVCDSWDHNGEEFKALVFEFISNGSLDRWLHPSTERMERLSLVQRLSIALDVAEALEYLHHRIDPSIAHCDIKPSNILLDEDKIAHVGDFGLAKIMNAGARGQCIGESSSVGIKGTIGYLAPEYGMGRESSTEGDIYSYGVLLLEILTGRRPTDTSIHDATSLPKFVEMAYPDKLLEILDNAMPQNANIQDIIDMYIAPISRLGLACCRDFPRERMEMGEVLKELSAIKTAWECKYHPIVDP
ncbi:unnamed protein product [Urochloa decumbens]|uniref:Receptor kinase-like protein Xa21 n=1 Tax=Urochloa decumbens TaxID=240449 RepID=A0ABC9AT69_9POAL